MCICLSSRYFNVQLNVERMLSEKSILIIADWNIVKHTDKQIGVLHYSKSIVLTTVSFTIKILRSDRERGKRGKGDRDEKERNIERDR